MENLILIVDIETTNFFERGGKIVEIGIVELDLETGRRRIVFDQVCHEKNITAKEVSESWIVQNSTLTVEMIRDSKCLDEYRDQIQKILDEYPSGCTAFNNSFDFKFLKDRGFKFPKELACPMQLSTDVLKLPPTPAMVKAGRNHYKTPNVQEAYNHFFGTDHGYVELHRGADDAFHEAQIVHKLYEAGIFTL